MQNNAAEPEDTTGISGNPSNAFSTVPRIRGNGHIGTAAKTSNEMQFVIIVTDRWRLTGAIQE